ncbi:Myosin type-2 heavy chain 1 [Savitreella phatthalungensis]
MTYMADDAYIVGQRCWLAHKDKVYISAEIIARRESTEGEDSISLELLDDDGDKHIIQTTVTKLKASDASLPALRNPTILEQVQDLTELSHLNTPSILNAIKARYQQREIYTYSGIVLVAVNPFEKVPIYDQTWVQQYAGKSNAMAELDPHLYAIAEDAYRCMIREKQNQTIIVSGESGAGKTVSARYIMRYFATAESADQKRRLRSDKREDVSQVERQILATNPIMESFGNAKTIRNDNSSRFGKYIELLFDDEAEIIGARMRTYLLERSRLNFQASNERNYHIFYQLCRGLDKNTRVELHLPSVDDLHYLNQGGNSVIHNVDDAADFEETCQALTLVGLSQQDQTALWTIMAAVLHIGNLEIVATRGNASLKSADSVLNRVSGMLGVDAEKLGKWVCKGQMRTRNEKIETIRTQREAIVVRDSIAKYIYSNVFDWLVDVINEQLCGVEINNRARSFIGVLDIYGFEHFKTNSFEQFCINYANEKLQQEFNSHVFKLEQEEYVAEGIPWQMIEFSDNAATIGLIEGKTGVLSLLDEQARLPSGSDSAFQQRLMETLKSSDQFSIPKLRPSSFTIQHYALPVTYDSEGFLDKNKDTVPEEIAELLAQTTNVLLGKILTRKDVGHNTTSSTMSTLGKGGASSRKPTLGAIFKSSLVRLMDTIDQTNAHYIRCIKPNEQKAAWNFEPSMVKEQLVACGVLETIRISAAGYPSRTTFQAFVERYFCLVGSEQWSGDDLKQLARTILETALRLDDGVERYQVGKSKVFFKPGVVAQLETRRTQRLNACATSIQNLVRAWLVARRRAHLVEQSRLLQRTIRGYLARHHAEDLRRRNRAATIVQSLVRGHQARLRLRSLHQERAATTIQRVWRGHRLSRRWRAGKSAVSSLQRVWLGKEARAELLRLKTERASVKHIQEKNAGLANKIMEQSRLISSHELRISDLLSRVDAMRDANTASEASRLSVTGERDLLQKRLGTLEPLEVELSKLRLEAKEKGQRLDKAEADLHGALKELEEIKLDVNQRQTALNAALVAQQGDRQARDVLQKEIETLKAEIARLRKLSSTSERRTNLGANSPRTPPRARLRRSLLASPSHGSVNDGSTAAPPIFPSIASGERSVSRHSHERSDASLDQQIMNILEDDDQLNNEIMYGMIQSLKMPQPSLQTPPSIDDILFPARLINLIVSEMWKWGYIKESERLLANVMQAIQQQVMTYEGDDTINPGAFWLSNVHEVLSFVWMAEGDILKDNAGMDDLQWQEYDRLISLVRHDLESLEFNIYHTWMKELKKRLSKMIVPALIESQALPGFMTNESNRFFNKILSSAQVQHSMDDILNLFNKIFKALRSYYVEQTVVNQTMTELLKLVGVVAFNDLLMRRNFLSWKRGLQINYNITRIEEWCKTHDMPELVLQLEHLMQATKLLQLKKSTIADIDILYDICWCLSNRQIHKLINQYYPADFENPISPEILKAVAGRVTQEETTDILLENVPLDEISAFEIAQPRQIVELRTPYVPSYLSLIRTKLLLKLLEEEEEQASHIHEESHEAVQLGEPTDTRGVH